VAAVEQMTLDMGHLMGLAVLVVVVQGHQQTEMLAQSTQVVAVVGLVMLLIQAAQAALELSSLKYLTT
jgi:hypothetical protein